MTHLSVCISSVYESNSVLIEILIKSHKKVRYQISIILESFYSQ